MDVRIDGRMVRWVNEANYDCINGCMEEGMKCMEEGEENEENDDDDDDDD
jgi:hypothetical protein